MLINKKLSGLVAVVICFYCSQIFAAPNFVQVYCFEDATKFPGIQGGNEISVNGKCAANEINVFKPRAIINADQLYNLCLPNVDTCNVTLLEGTNSENCSGLIIGNVVINVYKGVQSINNKSSKYKIIYQAVSPQAQKILILKN